MEINSKKYINEGFNSKAYIINDKYILLEGVNKNSYNNYIKYMNNIKHLNSIKSLKIPKITKLIVPNNEYPYGALVYEMIKGRGFIEKDIKVVNLDSIAKKLAEFMNEIYDIKINFDKKSYIDNEMTKMEQSILALKDYLNDNNEYEKIIEWSKEYRNYLLNFDDFHFVHGDLWYENYILNEHNEIIGIVDFENAGIGDPANDIVPLNYLGQDFINKFLYYYKYKNNELINRIPILIKAREICNFNNVINNYPEEISDQTDKIKNVIKS